MGKIIKAVTPYHNHNSINFKEKAFEAWVKCGGQVAESHYPPRWAHGAAYRWELPLLWKNKKEARLRFVEAMSVKFDTFPDYSCYEIIPFVWDCWALFFDDLCTFLERHNVKTVVITARQSAERIKKCFPQMNVLTIHEGVDVEEYRKGRDLKDRDIDLLEFGRRKDGVFKKSFPTGFKYKKRENSHSFVFQTHEQLLDGLANSKITVNFPKCDTNPEITGDVETLTQRYWESMLSRCVMVGRAPRELIDLIGYNPVIELTTSDGVDQIVDMVSNIENYQDMVDRNHAAALAHGNWTTIMKDLMKQLGTLGYRI